MNNDIESMTRLSNNRAEWPEIAKVVDMLKAVFGRDQVTVVHVEKKILLFKK